MFLPLAPFGGMSSVVHIWFWYKDFEVKLELGAGEGMLGSVVGLLYENWCGVCNDSRGSPRCMHITSRVAGDHCRMSCHSHVLHLFPVPKVLSKISSLQIAS